MATIADSAVGATGPLLAADGTPLKRKLRQAMMLTRVRAFLLVAPLLFFIMISFVIPIIALMWQGVYNNTFASNMPRVTIALSSWDTVSEPDEAMYAALVADLAAARESREIGKVATRVNRELSGARSLFTSSARRAPGITEAPFKENFLDAVGGRNAGRWQDLETWRAMKVASRTYTPAFYAAALDYQQTASGEIIPQAEERQIYQTLFIRTLRVSLMVTVFCIILGYPVAYLLATLPARHANVLLIFVLLPFWTSLLVRTTSWIAMLQSEGVLNDISVFIGITGDDNRFSMIYNEFGTIVAMTHILLPFMILPLYSVMKTISPSYVRAAKSLGASNFTAFWRIYAPNTIPGIGAGSLLVFILAIGYYITPALVGGQDGQLISNLIAYHMQRSLNWSLAAALGGILLAGVLLLYAVYDRVIGIDNVKLG